MNVYIEIFGYIGSALIIISMMMTSIGRLRIFSIAGSSINMAYSLISSVYPIAILNASLIIINVYHLSKYMISKRSSAAGEIETNEIIGEKA